MKYLLTGLIIAWTSMLLTARAAGDWNEGDPYKMHFPQLPNPEGWDVDCSQLNLADDWQCSQSGPVSDIHLWASWRGGVPATGDIYAIHLGIYDNVAGTGEPGSFSQPGEYQWQRWFFPADFTIRDYGTGPQGWLDPLGDSNRPDHNEYVQLNFTNIADPFEQTKDNVYWLQAHVALTSGSNAALGWKTSEDHFMDTAVFYSDYSWHELRDPTGEPLALAFVITPEPGTIVMLLSAGLVGVLACARRRAKRTA